MKKIGLIGGTFDPVHLGHISLALFIYKKYSLDKIFFIPTNISLNKSNITSYFHRRKMLSLSIKKYPQFKVSSWEKNGDGCFSHTLSCINKLTEDHQFFFIFGSDTIIQMNKWKNFSQIKKLASIISVNREDISPISSTQIRSLKKSGLPVTSLLNPLVESYIIKNNLY